MHFFYLRAWRSSFLVATGLILQVPQAPGAAAAPGTSGMCWSHWQPEGRVHSISYLNTAKCFPCFSIILQHRLLVGVGFFFGWFSPELGILLRSITSCPLVQFSAPCRTRGTFQPVPLLQAVRVPFSLSVFPHLCLIK